ncbi:MAG TPA: hypothetical protein VJV39_24425 [Dongiaceae bacterium]|nr:hypothetical protein [Dongiaceae bacterium]
MPGGWLSTIGVVAVCGAAAVAGVFLVGGLGGGGSRSAGGKEEAIAQLVGECQDALTKHRAIREHNTEAQIKGACNCVSKELYVRASDLDAEMAQADKVYSLRESMGPAIKNCIQRTGLGMSE